MTMTPDSAEQAATGWEPGGIHVQSALRGLTRAERGHVAAGYIGSAMPSMIRRLQYKGMFYLHIDSPNGMCGTMKLTPLGKNVHAMLTARTAATLARTGADNAG